MSDTFKESGYCLWVPVLSRPFSDAQKEELVRQLKRVQPELVMLTYQRIMMDAQAKKIEHEIFVENKRYLEENGFQVGAWLCPTIGYGGFSKNAFDNDAPFTRLTPVDGHPSPMAYCPLDEAFCREFDDIVSALARTGVGHIMFEDDFTFNGGKGTPFSALSCCCDRHLALYRKKLGRPIERDELKDWIYNHGKNDYRRLWSQIQGDTLRQFATRIEKTIHRINPQIRIGLSANSSSYNIEGATIDELTRIIAGSTRPFLRLTGAPYWDQLPSFPPSIEAARVQCAWCGEGIDLISEGDTYPRPRHWVPSALLEGFDTVLMAEGKTQGILKYMLDYTSGAEYETGYVDRHVRNQPLYAEIRRRFASGQTVGLNILERKSLFEEMEFGGDYPLETYGNRGYLPLVSQWFMTENSIPITYENREGATLVLGYNAEAVNEEILSRGVVLDIAAARLLMKRGIDVGLRSLERVKSPVAEYFPENGRMTVAHTQEHSVFYRCELDDAARVLSLFYQGVDGLSMITETVLSGQEGFPGCYLYENAAGQRFMVFTFVAESVTVYSIWKNGVFRNYCRQDQLLYGIEWLQGKPLPAVCRKNPGVYLLCKRQDDALTVGVWNFFADEVLSPDIELDGVYTQLDCYRCDGQLVPRSGKEGAFSSVRLSEAIPPYGFVCFTVR